VGVGDGAIALTLAEPMTEPDEVDPGAAPETFADSVIVSPEGALLGMAILACSWVVWPVCMVPSVQTCDPSPFPQTVNWGAGGAGEEWLASDEICTVTASAVLPFGSTVML
jgi:hypothetical protein